MAERSSASRRWTCASAERLLPSSDRIANLAQSALDYTWMDAVDTSDGVFITAEGLLMYLQPEEAMSLIRKCANRFPGGQMIFDLPPVLVKKLAPKGMRASRRYRVPPMPFSLSAAQLADLVDTVPGIRAVHDLPMPRGRGLVFDKLFPAFWALKPTKQFRGAYTLLEFGWAPLDESPKLPTLARHRHRRQWWPCQRWNPSPGKDHDVLLDGVNHIAWISKDVAALGRFYADVFDADVGPTRAHGQDPGETMTVIRIGPHTELNIVTIEGNTEADRQTPMWGRGRIDHLGFQAASSTAFSTIRQRLIAAGASDGVVNDFGSVRSMFFRDPDGLEGEVLVAKG